MPKQSFIYRDETSVLDAATRASLPGSFVELPDGFVHYEFAGLPGAQVVVLVPGISTPYFTWDPTFYALAQAGFRSLRFDLYGRGYSDRPETIYDAALFDRQIVGLLAALELNRSINLVGLSMGGALVASFAANHPERVRRLVLIDPLFAPPPPSLGLKIVLMPGVGERIMNWFADRILVGGQARDFHNVELLSAFQEKYRPAMRYRGFRRAVLSTIRSMPTWKIAEAYGQVGRADYPVLLFWGRQDRAIPFEIHRRVQTAIPRAEFHAIDNAGHVPHYEQPGVLNPILIDFLKRQSMR